MRINRRQFLKYSFTAGAIASCSVAAQGWIIEPNWVDITKIEMPIKGLGTNFNGKTIAHISDMHLDSQESKEYLLKCAKLINSLKPDITVLTGDFVTFTTARKYIDDLIEIFDELNSPLGNFACLGNHDYGVYSRLSNKLPGAAEHIDEKTQKSSVTILKNAAQSIEIENQKLWIVGLGDYWARDSKQEIAFENVPENEPSITLLHNPDAIEETVKFKPNAILCGHTHGGQVRIPFVGAIILPVLNRKYDAGKFDVNGCFAYVNRGLGTLPGISGSIRLNCRPEITLYTLKSV